MAQVITKDKFKELFKVANKKITLADGSEAVFRILNLEEMRTIRENNTNYVTQSDGKIKTEIDSENFMIDTIIEASVDPKFTDDDRDYFMRTVDPSVVNDIFTKIQSPLKLENLNEKNLKK